MTIHSTIFFSTRFVEIKRAIREWKAMPYDTNQTNDSYSDNREYWDREKVIKRLLNEAIGDKAFLRGMSKKKLCVFIGWLQKYRPMPPHSAMHLISEMYEELTVTPLADERKE